MKFQIKKHNFLVIFILVLLLFSVFFQRTIKNATFVLFKPILTIGRFIEKPFENFFLSILVKQDLWQENQKLLGENLRLKKLVKEFGVLKNENESLKQLLKIKSVKKISFIEAEVIGGNFLEGTIYINAGTKEKIQPKMVVVSLNGSLVGTIQESFSNYSQVLLITDPQVKLLAETEKGEECIVQGKGDILTLKEFPKEKSLQEGTAIFTSSLSGFPPNLPIGEVIEVEKSDLSPFTEAKIKPFFLSHKLDKVLIIINWHQI